MEIKPLGYVPAKVIKLAIEKIRERRDARKYKF